LPFSPVDPIGGKRRECRRSFWFIGTEWLMALSQNEIQRVAHLARIKIDDAMLPRLQQQLDSILDMIDALSKINTDGVAPMAHAQPLALPLREDRITEPNRRDHYQQGAPAVQDGLYLVPKVIE